MSYCMISNNGTVCYHVVRVASCRGGGPEQLFFCPGFRPFSKVGNSQLHSTRFDYLRSYGYPRQQQGSRTTK